MLRDVPNESSWMRMGVATTWLTHVRINKLQGKKTISEAYKYWKMENIGMN